MRPMDGPSPDYNLIVIGGGAAGFFGAITAGEAGLDKILILEKGPEILTKVRISGGGRCNVTHDCFDPHELVQHFPRGMKNLLGPFHRFQPADTISWFENHGVDLKTEADGRMFPITDDSATIIACLTEAARNAGVSWRTHCGLEEVTSQEEGFEIKASTGENYRAKKLLVATGGIRSKHARLPAEQLGHELSAPVPSLFTFKINDSRLHDLQGVSVPSATLRAGKIETSGPLLITHWGLSGPATLKNSAWGARDLEKVDYHFTLEVNWTGNTTPESLTNLFEQQRQQHGARKIVKRSPIEGLTRRLWQRLVLTSGISEETKWATLPRPQSESLIKQLTSARFEVTGKSLNKEEFVTCGGVSLDSLSLKTMESRTVSGLYFAGEILDVDGITGGFNFQSAWTTAHLAGLAITDQSL